MEQHDEGYIVVDLDGTLIEESAPYLVLLKELFFEKPLKILSAAILYLFIGPNKFTINTLQKNIDRLCLTCAMNIKLRFNKALVHFLKQLQEANKILILATGSDECIGMHIAQVMYKFFQIRFSYVIGSTPGFLCVSENKLAKVRSTIPSPFIYIGNSAQDYPLWRANDVKMICVGNSSFKRMAELSCRKPAVLIPPDFQSTQQIVASLTGT